MHRNDQAAAGVGRREELHVRGGLRHPQQEVPGPRRQCEFFVNPLKGTKTRMPRICVRRCLFEQEISFVLLFEGLRSLGLLHD
jgi:hypothetical protein